MHALHAARRITFTAPLATVLLASLAIVPALVSPASASATVLKDLQVTSATCSGVSVTAQGMPASSQLFLLVKNIANGATVMGPAPVHSDAAGAVQTRLATDLSAVRSIDVSIWTKTNQTLTMAASNRATTSCGALPVTGAATSRGLLVAVLLLGLGGLVVWRTRYAPRHALRIRTTRA